MNDTLQAFTSQTDSSQELDLSELLRLRALKRALERRDELRKENGLLYYVPHSKQDKFHSAGGKRRRYVRTGNRWGKSTAGAAEDIAWCMGERIWYPEGDPRRTVGIPERSVKGVLIVQDWDKAAEIFTSQDDGESMGKLFKLLPRAAFVEVEKNQSGHICKLLIRSKWGGVSALCIDTVKSFKSNPMGHESSDWDFVHVDEPLPKEMWAAYSRGLVDRRGSAWFMCTPITELWINDYFIPRGQGRREFDDGQTFDTVEQNDYWVMTGSSMDNPALTREAIADFTRDVPAHELESRIYGRPKMLAGIIHREFDRDLHVYSETPHGWISPTTPPANWAIRCAIDPHPKIPMAVLFSATNPYGYTYFFAEIWQKFHIDELCQMIKSRLSFVDAVSMRTLQMQLCQAVCDPLAWTPNPINGRTMADEFTVHGIPVSPGSKAMMEGILRTGELLRARDAQGNPMVKFHESLAETLYEFDRYVWDPETEKPDAKAPDHMMENLHRLVLTGLTWMDMTQPLKIIQPRRDENLIDFSLPRSTKPKPRIGSAARYLC